MVNISKKRICADEAFAAYMALGPSRTLPRLRERYRRDSGVIPPALSTMKRWSTKDEWQARAREHDIQVQGETSRLAIEREAEQRVEVSQVVEDTYRDMLAQVRQLLPQTSGDGMIMELVTAAGLPQNVPVGVLDHLGDLDPLLGLALDRPLGGLSLHLNIVLTRPGRPLVGPAPALQCRQRRRYHPSNAAVSLAQARQGPRRTQCEENRKRLVGANSLFRDVAHDCPPGGDP